MTNDADIEIVVSPADGKWGTAEKIIKKIYESYDSRTLCKIRIRVENVHAE